MVLPRHEPTVIRVSTLPADMYKCRIPVPAETPIGDICFVSQWLNEPNVPVVADCMQGGTGSHAPQSAAALRSSAGLLEHIYAQVPQLSLGDERSKQLFQKLVDNYHRARQLIAESLGVSDERGLPSMFPWRLNQLRKVLR